MLLWLFLIKSTLYCIQYINLFVTTDLAQFDGAESNITLLISAAENVENLCRMDPAWNAWM